MVLGRNDKRKRKEGDLVDLMDPLSESPKRTKVHAQRKFAQGAATVFSPAPPLVKEKEKTKAPVATELITHKRPNTEDFLTFLCFRGTSILPPSLNFFNVGTRKEKTESKGNGGGPKSGTKTSLASSVGTNGVSCGKGESSGTGTIQQSSGNNKVGAKSLTSVKKKVVANGVPTTLSKYKNATSTVQALKKKYQEQRLAKQRIKNKLKASCVMRTRSSTDHTPEEKSVRKIPARKLVGRTEKKRRGGLRSGGFIEKPKKVITSKSLASKVTRKRASVVKEESSSSASEDSESASLSEEEEDEEDEEEEEEEEEEDDDEVEEEEESRPKSSPIIRKAVTSATKAMQKKICTRSKSEMRRITRSQKESSRKGKEAVTGGLLKRPTRKTKEAAAVYMEILGRKLVSPELDNEDNVSVDSFPELPNARRTAQAENEMRAKRKAAKRKETKRKEAKKDETIGSSRTRTKPEKLILKSGKRRTLRVRRYCELDSEDDSESSGEPPEKPKECTPRRAAATTNRVKIVEKASPRSLRSSSRNQSAKTESVLGIAESRTRDKIIKRPVKVAAVGEKATPRKEKIEESEEEESLGNLLTKMTKNKKKQKKEEEEKCVKSASKVESTERKVVTNAEKMEKKARDGETRIASQQVSDDEEESFRGFTKKAISKVLNSCNSHASANLLASEEATAAGSSSQEIPKIETGTKSSETSLEKLVIDDSSREFRAISSVKSSQEATTTIVPKNEEENPSVELGLIKLEKKENETMTASNEAAAAAAAATTINLMDMPLSGVHGRKARVNMSTEQIEKWLNESSMAREESHQKSDNDASNNFHQFDAPSSKMKSESSSHLSIPTRIQHLVRPVNVTIPKLVEKSARERSNNNRKKMMTNLVELERFSSLTGKHIPEIPVPNRNKINADMKEIIKGRSSVVVKAGSRERNASIAGEESDGVSKSDQNSVDGSSPDKKSTPEKKPMFQQRKTFLPKVKERKTAIPSANAFSPENESSVYAFESDTEVPINTPFRRKLKERANNKPPNSQQSLMMMVTSDPTNVTIQTPDTKTTRSKLSSSTETIDKFVVPKSFESSTSQVQVLPSSSSFDSGVTDCGASIAVQVNFDEPSQQRPHRQHQQQQQQRGEGDAGSGEKKLAEASESNASIRDKLEIGIGQHNKCTEISTQTENTIENENEEDGGHVFYIPLQSVGRNGPNLVQGQQLIQGVAVKLGTEGPNGPNQRVLLRAQLVTKPPMSVARCPPVGTVQPTTRNPPNSSGSTTSVLDHPYAVLDPSQPSTSTTNSPQTPGTDSTLPPQTPTCTAAATRLTCHPSSTSAPPHNDRNATTKSPKSARERKASVDSTKTAAKRVSAKSRQKMSEILAPSNATIFPGSSNSNAEARLVEAPTFHPTEKDFQDPLEYIDKIRSIAEKFGICRVVPPANFKPECKVSDDMRFTAYNQYVHRMLHRWGPNVKEMMAIKKYLATQSITLTHPPWIGGMEVDLPHLYQTVQSLGGLKEVIEKKKWQKVADGMKIPKSAQDRVTKLDDIYCKYLLPYDTLSPVERGNLFDDVEEDWKRRETKTMQRLDCQSTENDDDEDEDSSDEIEECIIKGRNMPLNAFYRIARNTQRMWFGENQRPASEAEGASAIEVEAAFWKHVAERKRHVCVHAASIDSSGRGFGFSVAKNSPFARHPWNLKVLTNNAGSVLRALGPLMGVTVPTLHVGMLFSACCWYRDPHGLPWIEYLHTGAKKIWYGIPDEHNNNFREALSKMVPRYCKKKTIWLPSDTAMVPPELLVNNGVPLCRTVQEPGQFIVVFPKAFTSSICTGYVVSESVYFAQPAWLENAEQVFKDLQDSCEPSIFSFERLLFSIINDSRSQYDVLKQIMPVVIKIRERELEYRKQLEYIGLREKEKLPLPGTGKGKKGKKIKEEDGDFECESCRANLFVSLVNNSQDDSVYCLPHALQLIVRKKQVLKHCTLMYTYTEDELDDLIHKLEDRIEAKSKKPHQIRQSK